MRLLVVIVCYRVPELTINCLRSLAGEVADTPGMKVAVCENGTGGDSARRIAQSIAAEGWQRWVTLTEIHPNRGFAGGNNVILRQALQGEDPPDYFLLLNADTVVRSGAVRQMLDTADSDQTIGLVGPRLEWPDGDGQISCFRYLSPLSELIRGAGTGPITRLLRRYDVPIPLSDQHPQPEWMTFACCLIRRTVVEQIGLLDEGYLLYFDDVDFCRRAGTAGWQLRYCPGARVVHLRGQSNPVKSLTAQRKRRPAYYYASRSRYFAKFYGRAGLFAANGLWHCGHVIARLRETIGSKKPHACEAEWRDIWTNARHPLDGKPAPAESEHHQRQTSNAREEQA